jgi:hypothetical protein
MSAYRVFEVESGQANQGARIDSVHLKGPGVDISAIVIGEEGRGRSLGIVPVDHPPMADCPHRRDPGGVSLPAADSDKSEPPCPKCGVAMPRTGFVSMGRKSPVHPTDEGSVLSRLSFAEIGQTRTGNPKLTSKSGATTDEQIIVVFRTHIGYRGGNSHTGDRTGEMATDTWGDEYPKSFHPFPGTVISKGTIAQGTAGRMGAGDQFVALIPKGVVFRTGYSGRLYGGPQAHYYTWDGENLLAATWEERSVSDLF